MNDNKEKKEKEVSHSRRSFLTTAAATGGVLAVGGALSQAQAATQSAHAGHQMNSYGTMMFMKDHKMPKMIRPPGAPAEDKVKYKEFDMDVQLIQHEILPGIKTHAFAFNGQLPGPEFHVNEGDWVKVNFTNKTEEMHTIHWHGLTVPYTMDGVPMVTQDPVHPGQTFVYKFQANPAGTRWYHCHWGTPLHAAIGMHGAFIVHKKKDPLKKVFPYDREYTLMLESFDINFAREEINGLLEGMKQVNLLMKKGKLDPMTHGFFRNYEEFLKAYKDGKYIPPYLQSRSSGVPIEPNFFGINGKSYPATKRIGIRQGEWIRVRLISASNMSHHMHLHGHDFWWVAQDGNDLTTPRKLNTIHVEPGGTYDIMIYGDNPGFWTFHDHNTRTVRNNGIYPGGMLTVLQYEDLKNPPYLPSVSLDQ
ncbi:MAG: FtsP/CotA-like multicopper oxidase with cupredoxin domain [bacterium]|jgi:FtsP/CotA-like multicopper oxidase with cupredoxin domain